MYCGFDIGGTKVLGVATHPDNPADPVAVRRELTIADGDALIETIEKMVGALEADCAARITAVGVGIAGIVDHSGVLKYSPNIEGVFDLDLPCRLSEALGRPVTVENDATAAVWAEAQHGAAQGCSDVVLATLGTGLGTGFMLDGRLHRGFNGFAGESGHMTIDMSGPRHLTGVRGPWEYYASGSGLRRMACEAAARGDFDSLLADAGDLSQVRGEHIHTLVVAGDAGALSVLDEFCSITAVGLANLVHILDPEVLVIGGGLIDMGEPLVRRLRDRTHALVLGGDHRRAVRVVPSHFGSKSGAVGAAMLAAAAVASNAPDVSQHQAESDAAGASAECG